MRPFIKIIVLHYKNLDDTIICLKSLTKINYFAPVENTSREVLGYSIIVVNNDRPSDAEQIKKNFPNISVIQNNSNLGFAEGNNVGIREALKDKKTEAVLIINNDTKVDPRVLSEMSKKLQKEQGKKIGMVAPKMMRMDNPEKIDNLGIVLMKSGLPFNRMDKRQKLFCPSGGCALYSRELLEDVVFEENKNLGKNYFDPTYFAYAEDLDLGFRARLLGFEADFAENAIVLHKGSASTSLASNFSVYRTYRNLVWTQYKNFSFLLFTRMILWLFAGWGLILAYYSLKGKPKLIAKAFFDGIRELKPHKEKRVIIQKNKKTSARKIISWLENGLFPKNLI